MSSHIIQIALKELNVARNTRGRYSFPFSFPSPVSISDALGVLEMESKRVSNGC